jgi:hypothetical protein
MLYMRLVMGNMPTKESYAGFGVLLRIFLTHGILLIGAGIGVIIALLFIGIDMLYLKKKLKHKPNRITERIAVFLGITFFVILTHYVMEVVIDII